MKKSLTKYNRGTYRLFVFPALVLYLVFALTPILTSVFYSFTDWNGLSKNFDFVGVSNYLSMFRDARLGNAMKFTLLYTLLYVVGVLILSLVCAQALNSKLRGQTFFRSIFFFPAVISMIAIGMIWNEIFYRAFPALGQTLGIEWLQRNMLGNPDTAMYGILAVSLWQGIAIPTVLLIAGFQVIPKELYEAATIDGANAWHRFRSITVPFLIPVINVVLVLALKAGITVFDNIRVLTDGGPGRTTESISLLIYRNAFVDHKFSFGVTQSIVLFLLIAAISVFQFGVLNKKEVGEV